MTFKVAELDKEKFLAMPFGKVMEIYANLPEQAHVESAMIGVSVALGDDPPMQNVNESYFEFLRKLTERIAKFVENGAALELVLLSFHGSKSTQITFDEFLPVLRKKIAANKDLSIFETLLNDSDNAFHFFHAVTSMTALMCKHEIQMASLFGLKRAFFRRWKFKPIRIDITRSCMIRSNVEVEDRPGSIPYGNVMLSAVHRSKKELFAIAMIGVSHALGTDHRKLSSDKKYRKFIRSYVEQVLSKYVAKAAAMQLTVSSLFGDNSTENTFSLFAKELDKVKNVVLIHEEAADLIMGDTRRTWDIFVAVTSLTALLCKRDKRVAELFGLKKTRGGWKFGGRD